MPDSTFPSNSFLRTESLRGFEWNKGLDAVRLPLVDLQQVINVDELLRMAGLIQNNGWVAVTFISKEYLGVGKNWIAAMRRLHMSHYLVICGDKESFSCFDADGISSIRATLAIGDEPDQFRSRVGFSAKGLAMTSLKFPVVHKLVAAGFSVVLSDADALWLQDPTNQLPGDIAFQRIAYFPEPIARYWGFAACSGFVSFRGGHKTLSFLDSCVREQAEVQSDQIALNLALLETGIVWTNNAASADNDPMARPPFERPALIELFKANATFSIFGKTLAGLEVVALPHHRFWRHSWVPFDRTQIIVCHPNTPKEDAVKLIHFERLALRFEPNN